MENNDGLSIIHKKARVAREDFDARAMSAAKALRLALAKAAEDRLDMALTVTTVEQTRQGISALSKTLSEDMLLILLDGTGGARGAAILDVQVVTALIEMQVTGTVRQGEAQTRSYTRTDAAMMAPLLDAALAGADALMADKQDGYQPRRFRFGDKVDDARVLSLALQGLDFDVFRMSLSLENGAKTGLLCLALPVLPKVPDPVAGGASEASRPVSSLKKLALNAPVTLNAVLARLRRPLDEICGLQPGMLLPVSPEAIETAELVARPCHLVAEGRLGQVAGMRAVRIRLKPDEEIEPPHADHARIGSSTGSDTSDLPEQDRTLLSRPDTEPYPDPDEVLPTNPVTGVLGNADDGESSELDRLPADLDGVGSVTAKKTEGIKAPEAARESIAT